MTHARTRFVCFLAFLAATAVLLLPSAANAQVSRLGDTFALSGGGARGSDIAFDSTNGVYLAVWSFGTLRGRYISADGVPIGDPFPIQADANISHFPRVAFSPDAGAFLVTWHASVAGAVGTDVYSRIVSYTQGLGAQARLLAAEPRSFWECGPAVAYATGSKEFLVVWQGIDANIHGARVNTSGAMIAPVDVAVTVGEGERDPNVTYNPQTDEFFAVYSGYNASFAFVRTQRIKAGTGELIGGPTQIGASTGTYITDVEYSPSTGKYLAAWFQPGGTYGRPMNADGSPAGDARVLSTRYTTYDALRLAFNRTSGTIFAVSQDGRTAENGGVEIDSNGTPLTTGVQTTLIGGRIGNFYPRVAAHSSRAEWTHTTAHEFSTAVAQRFKTDTRTGPPPPISNPRMSIDAPDSGSTHVDSLVVAGWALDLAAPAGTGIDAIHVWAFPTNGGQPVFFGSGATGGFRPDVGAVFGPQFDNSGYHMSGALPAGNYDLVVYAHSSVTDTFSNSRSVRVRVRPAGSTPQLAIDAPQPNATLGTSVTVSGWAIDLGAPSGNGVDAVHVWAWPTSGGAPIFFGATAPNVSRPDVANVFGSQFGLSGYWLTGTLPPGTYDLVVYAHSAVTGTFNNAQGVRVSVGVEPSKPRMGVEAPTTGQTVGQSFTITGWAIDQSAWSGVGVDAIHVWAYPADGGAAVFAGAAAPSIARSDVAETFGATFLTSGFSFTGTLPPGTYSLVVFARSTVAGTFNNAILLPITVQ